MIQFLSSILMVMKDVKEEIKDKGASYIFVSSRKELITKLKGLDVDPSKVKFLDSGSLVKNWDEVAGVFKVKDEIYAYSSDIKSELGANLHSV